MLTFEGRISQVKTHFWISAELFNGEDNLVQMIAISTINSYG